MQTTSTLEPGIVRAMRQAAARSTVPLPWTVLPVSEEDAEFFDLNRQYVARSLESLDAMHEVMAEHIRVLTHGGKRPERANECHCLGCLAYRAALAPFTDHGIEPDTDEEN